MTVEFDGVYDHAEVWINGQFAGGRPCGSDGVRVPDAAQTVSFELTGPARILGIGNGDLNNSEIPQNPVHQAYQGRGLAIL